MLLKKTLQISLNTKEMLRFICKRQRLHSYLCQINGVKTNTKSFPGWMESQKFFQAMSYCLFELQSNVLATHKNPNDFRNFVSPEVPP